MERLALNGGGPPADWLVAPAKINLALHVTARRPDGFHDLDTLVMFADIGDRLSVSPADELSIHVSGQFAGHVPKGTGNLVIQVATALKAACGTSRGAQLQLEKNIPPGAGLGGGSADAAVTLRALNNLWQARFSVADLADIGGRFGADIPMCLQSSALRASDTGARVEDWPDAPDVPMVLVWPSRIVSTGAVFSALAEPANPPMPDIALAELADLDTLFEFLQHTRNDMSDAAATLEPEIAKVLATLAARPDCVMSRMSGSGSACFGLFASSDRAEAAARTIAGRHEDWWVRAVTAR